MTILRPVKRFLVEDDDGYRKWTDTIDDAERIARNRTERLGWPCEIYDFCADYEGGNRGYPGMRPIRPCAVTHKDALGRVWTDVTAAPGQETLL